MIALRRQTRSGQGEKMQDNTTSGPSLIKLGKLANGKKFDELESIWVAALDNTEYTWRELLPIAGQVGRQGAPDKADALMDVLIGWVEEKLDPRTALQAARNAARQLPKGKDLRRNLTRLYIANHEDFAELPDLIDLILTDESDLAKAIKTIDRYVLLQPGDYALDRSYLVAGLVQSVRTDNGVVEVLFKDRHAEYGPATLHKLTPKPRDYFPAMMLYAPEHLEQLADTDAVAFVKLALNANREGRLGYRELKGHVTALKGEAGWKTWWVEAKAALKHEPMIGMSGGSQPAFRLLRQADRYEDRLRREFDHNDDPVNRLQQVSNYLDELSREEKQNSGADAADTELLEHFGNGAAKIAVAALKTDPAIALAGLALHAEIAARGVNVARPNPRAAAQVLERLTEVETLATALPEALLNRTLLYIRRSLPDSWGTIWAQVLLRASKRLCDVLTKGLIEGGQGRELELALLQALSKPTSSPDLLAWLWRARHTSSTTGKFLSGLENLPVEHIAKAMFSLLDSVGKLYGLSGEERHLKTLESARNALAAGSYQPLLTLFDEAGRSAAIGWKKIVEPNHGISAAQRTQLLGYLRSKHADIFVEATGEWEDGSVIYSTEAGLRSVQDKLNHIIEEEIPAVAKQIGEAASFGDLSENAEFTAALEKRDQLASNATRLENELAMAQVITHEMAHGSVVNAGTRVTARLEATEAEEVYTFLGPWDTDTERRVLNYQAPLAQAFMGAAVGDVVEFGEESERRRWKILAIEPAI